MNPRRLLHRDEEIELCEIVQGKRAGDPERALARLTEKNMGLMSKLAGRFCQGEDFPFGDAVTEAYIGFHTAVLKFDGSRGTKLSTCATSWMTQALMRARDDKSRTIRLPNHVSEMVKKYWLRCSMLEEKLGRVPTMDDKIEHLGLSEKRILAIEAVPQGLLSLDAPATGDGKNGGELSSFGDFVPDPKSFDAGSFVEAVDLKQVSQACLSLLREKERMVLQMRYGFPPYDHPHALDAIGQVLGMTREGVRQIEVRALRHVRIALGMSKDKPTKEEKPREAANLEKRDRPRDLETLRARNDAVLALLDAGEDEWVVSTRFDVGVQRVRRIATEARNRRRFANGEDGG